MAAQKGAKLFSTLKYSCSSSILIPEPLKVVNDLVKILVDLRKNPELVSQIANQAFEDKKVFSRDNVIQTYLTAINNV